MGWKPHARPTPSPQGSWKSVFRYYKATLLYVWDDNIYGECKTGGVWSWQATDWMRVETFHVVGLEFMAEGMGYVPKLPEINQPGARANLRGE